MGDKIALIEPDERLRKEVLGSLSEAGFYAEPFEGTGEFLQFRGRGSCSVLVGDERVDALGVRVSLCREGEWMAVIGYSAQPALRRIVAFIRGGGYDYFALPIDTALLARSVSRLNYGQSAYAAARQRAAEAHCMLENLSPREAEVLDRMATGRSNKAIGIELGISPRTVEIHRANMLSKLRANTSTEALRMFFEDALLNGKAAAPVD